MQAKKDIKTKVVYPVKLEKTLYKKLQKIGQKEERSVNFIINRILEDSVK